MKGRVRSAVGGIPVRVRRYLVNCFRVDTRALAVFRVIAGALVVADLVLRSRNLVFFYSDLGVVPVERAMARTSEYAVSVYYLTGDPTWTALLFVVQALIAVQLIVGYKTRIAIVLTFLLVVSLDHRNTLVLSYADTLFRLLLFWSIFLPLGERWSVDEVHRSRSPRRTVANLASAAILLQMVAMYFVNGLHKRTSEVWRSGEAAPLVLGLTDMTWFLAPVVREFPDVLQMGGLLWYWMMLAAPLLVLLHGRLRAVYASLYFWGHVSFALTTRIGAFPYVAIMGLVPFLQTRFWDDLARLLAAAGFTSDLFERLSDFGRIFARGFPDVGVGGSRVDGLKHGVYVGCLTAGVAGMLVLGGVSVAIQGGVVDDEPDVYDDVDELASAINVDPPSWSVFAPNPRTTDRFYVFPALTEDGERYDVYNDRELSYSRPHEELHHIYDSYRERFYMNSVRRADTGHWIPSNFATYICDSWGEERGEELTHLNMEYVSESYNVSTLTEFDRRDRMTISMHEYGCGDRDPMDIEVPENR